MGLPKGYTGKTPLWNLRRNHSFMTTMLAARRVRYNEKLAADQWKIDELAREIAELEKAESE